MSPDKNHRTGLRALCLLALLALLAGCAQQAVRAPEATPAQSTEARARALEAEGRHKAAADLYFSMASAYTGQQRDTYRRLAAESMIRAGDLDEAGRILGRLPTPESDTEAALALRLARAELAVAQRRPMVALDLLASPLPADVPVPTLVRYHRLRARAYALGGNLVESARERVWMDALLADPEARRANREAIWRALSEVPTRLLDGLAEAGLGDELSGWIELVRDLRHAGPGEEARQTAIDAWRARYPEHPAISVIDELRSQPGAIRLPTGAPGQIGVLLPLSGRLAGVAEAVRNGMLAATFNQPDPARRPQLRFYDTGGDPQRVWSLYQQAISEGADWVVGPLTKPAVAELLGGAQLGVPVLALNRADPGIAPPPGLYQFGLAPEDEAAQVADYARSHGYQRALAMVPAGDWGDRVLDAFRERWVGLGGELLESARLPSDPQAETASVRALLNIDASHERAVALERLLGRNLEFEPRPRQDADFLMLAARPAQARFLKPLLSFYRAGDLPVLATSAVYSGMEQPGLDSDLDGILFCDLPWLIDPDETGALRAAVAEAWPEGMQRYPRLYALGLDAARLPFEIATGGLRLGGFSGVTGLLNLGPDQVVHRVLPWARFVAGVPRLVEPVSDLQPLPGPGEPAAFEPGPGRRPQPGGGGIQVTPTRRLQAPGGAEVLPWRQD